MLLRTALSVNRVASIYHSLPGALLVLNYVLPVSTGLAGDLQVPPGYRGLTHALPVLVLSLLLPVGPPSFRTYLLLESARSCGSTVYAWNLLKKGWLCAGQATEASPCSCGLFPV